MAQTVNKNPKGQTNEFVVPEGQKTSAPVNKGQRNTGKHAAGSTMLQSHVENPQPQNG